MNKKEILKCDCGEIVKGINEKHLKYTFRIHKTSKKHKERIDFIAKELFKKMENKKPLL